MAAKEPVLFVPGLLCDRALYAHQMAHLAEVASPHFVGVPDKTSVGEMAADVLAAAPERFSLVGLSMGGMIAFEILRRAPERVSKVALLDTRAEADPPERVAIRENLARRAESGHFEGIPGEHVLTFIAPHRISDAGLVGAVTAMAYRVGPKRYAAQQRAIGGRHDNQPFLSSIACPTLVLVGRLDELTPVQRHREIAAAIPGARLAIVEGSGHLSTMEAPEAVTALLRDWLVYDR